MRVFIIMSCKNKKKKGTIYESKRFWLLTPPETASLLGLAISTVYAGRQNKTEKWQVIDTGLFCHKNNITSQMLSDFIKFRNATK